MKWIDFFTWSAILYLLYYGVNILLDISRGVRTQTDVSADNVLHFKEDLVPTDASAAVPQEDPLVKPVQKAPMTTIPKEKPVTSNKIENPIEGSGVTINDFFKMAMEESFEFTKTVSFAQ